ncbi:hypothetical protein LSE82_005235 [Salmonella enterica]|nr:hypothetical protein [Salmonella enterica]
MLYIFQHYTFFFTQRETCKSLYLTLTDFLNLREAACSGQQIFAVRGGDYVQTGVVAGISLGQFLGQKVVFWGILGQKRTYEDRASSYNLEMQLFVIYRRIHALGRSFSILEN